MTRSGWPAILAMLLLTLTALQGEEPRSIRVNDLSPSVFRAAGDFNHAIQVVDDSMQIIWVGRDRFAFPFYAEVDLETEKVTRRMKLTEKRGRGKGLRMNPAIGRYQGQTWVAWIEEIRRQRRSKFMLNLRQVEAVSDDSDGAESTQVEQEEAASQPAAAPDPRQIFDLGRFLAPVTFHETAQGFFALTNSQDSELAFRIHLFRLESEGKWKPVESALKLEGMKPVFVDQGGRLWLYFTHPQGGVARSFSQDGLQWSEPERFGEEPVTSVQAVSIEDGVAAAWSISGQETVQVRLSRCGDEGCSPPSEIIQRPGRLGRILLSAQPSTHHLILICSYWDHENQSQVIEGFSEAQGFEAVRLSPDDEYVTATRVPLLYNGANSAFAAWDQTAGREANSREGGMVAVAEYDYGESRWKPSVATYLAGAVNMFATAPQLARHGDSLWASFVAYRGPDVNEHGQRQMPMAASTGDLYLVRVEPDQWEARGAEQAGKNYEPARN